MRPGDQFAVTTSGGQLSLEVPLRERVEPEPGYQKQPGTAREIAPIA